jgi:hypothetical protein
MPVRKIPTNHRSLTGATCSVKNNRLVSVESSLERDMARLLEFDPYVDRFVEQPLTVEYTDTYGIKRRYTPDFLVYYRKDLDLTRKFKPMLCEIKYRKELKEKWNELKPKFAAALKYASDRQWRFKILTEKEIRTEYLANASFLARYRHTSVDSSQVSLLLDIVEELKLTTPAEVLLAASRDEWKRAELLHTFWYLVANFFVGCDLNFRLQMDTAIWSKLG